MGSKYRAFQLTGTGQGSPNYALQHLAMESCNEGEVVVRVAFCGLNRLDLWMEAGDLPVEIPLPRTPGGEVSGVIDSVGAGVTDVHPGDHVIVQSNISCGTCEFCESGEDSRCLKGKLLGVDLDGGLAELVKVPARSVIKIAPDFDLASAASVVLAGSTAMHMLTDRTEVTQGDWVLVMGGNSGVGAYAIQIAKNLGARVIATASSSEKATLAESLGAEFTVNHHHDGWNREVRKITGKRGVDIIVEHMGGKILEDCFHCLSRGGAIVTCGATTGKKIQLDLWPFFVKEQKLIGSYGRTRNDLVQTLDWTHSGKLNPVISEIFPLEQAESAFKTLRDRSALGKVLVSC